MEKLSLWLLSFLVGFLVDFLYVVWFRAQAEDARLKAVVATVLLSVCSQVGFLSSVDDRALCVPYDVGLAAGCWIGMATKKKRGPLQGKQDG